MPTRGENVGDFVEYWASAHLLLAGKNPYSPEDLLVLQRSVGWKRQEPLLMWNPPWALFFLIPFGLVSFPIGQVLWLMLNSACLVVCSARLWRMYGGPAERHQIAWLACFSFVPVGLTIYLGQIDPLVLAGIVAFLHFQERRQWWLAGCALTLVAIKPHLAYVFWLTLLAWILAKRRWQVAVGALIAAIAETLIPMTFVGGIFGHYVQLYSTTASPVPLSWATPTLSSALVLLFGIENLWVRFIPSVVTVIWCIFYWRKEGSKWDWKEQMPLLLLVSQATTMFAWTFDQALLLPAVIQGTVWYIRGRPSNMARVALLAFALINLAHLLLVCDFLISNALWLFWTAPALLLVYLGFRAQTDRQSHRLV